MNSHNFPRLLSIGRVPYSETLSGHKLNHKSWLGLAKRIKEVYLIALSTDIKGSISKDQNITLYRIPKLPGVLDSITFLFLSVVIGLWLVRAKKIDTLDASDPLSAGMAGIILKYLTGLPLLVHVQAELFNLPVERFTLRKIRSARTIATLVCNRADRVRTVSKKVAEQAISAGVAAEKIVVLPSRCDTAQFDPEIWKESGRVIRHQLGWEKNRIILFIGSLNISKSVGNIIDAFSLLLRRFPDARLLIVGDGSLREELLEQVKKLELVNAVFFFGGVSYDNVPSMLAAGDLFVSPSLDEGMPRSVLEAMSMRLPVVVTPVGGNPEIVIDGENGLLVPPKDPHALEEAMASLLSNPEKMQKMGIVGRNRVASNHDFEEQLDRLAILHQELWVNR